MKYYDLFILNNIDALKSNSIYYACIQNKILIN